VSFPTRAALDTLNALWIGGTARRLLASKKFGIPTIVRSVRVLGTMLGHLVEMVFSVLIAGSAKSLEQFRNSCLRNGI
jgi:hypothetical protein